MATSVPTEPASIWGGYLGKCTFWERREVGSNEPTLVHLVGSIEPDVMDARHLTSKKCPSFVLVRELL